MLVPWSDNPMYNWYLEDGLPGLVAGIHLKSMVIVFCKSPKDQVVGRAPSKKSPPKWLRNGGVILTTGSTWDDPPSNDPTL